MFKLIRNLMYLAVLVALAYASCTFPVGGKTVLAHMMDIYNSDVVQTKVGFLKRGVRDEVQRRVLEVKQKSSPGSQMDQYTQQEKSLIDDAIAENLQDGGHAQ